jgi:hypothetical protein
MYFHRPHSIPWLKMASLAFHHWAVLVKASNDDGMKKEAVFKPRPRYKAPVPYITDRAEAATVRALAPILTLPDILSNVVDQAKAHSAA